MDAALRDTIAHGIVEGPRMLVAANGADVIKAAVSSGVLSLTDEVYDGQIVNQGSAQP